MEQGGAKACAMQRLHARTDGVQGEPRVMLQAHSGGWGGGVVGGVGCQASHQQMDKPRRRMCAMCQMHQQLAGARKCQVSAASHAVAAIHTIPREPGCTHKAWWSGVTEELRVKGGGGGGQDG